MIKSIQRAAISLLLVVTPLLSNTTPPSESANFINYNLANPNNNYSYTLGISLQGKYALSPYLSAARGYSITGSTEQDDVHGKCYIENGSFYPRLSGEFLISNNTAGSIVSFKGGYEEQTVNPYFINATDTHGLLVPTLDKINKGTYTYTSMAGKHEHKYADGSLSLIGYAVERQNTTFTSQIGATVAGFRQEVVVRGNKSEPDADAEEEEIVDDCDLFSGTQESISCGLIGNIKANLVIDQSLESAVFVSGCFTYTSEINFNNGSGKLYSRNGEINTYHQSSTIPNTTRSNFCSKELSLTMVSKPTAEDMSFITLTFGIGSQTNFNKNLLSLIYSNTMTDLSSVYGFINISITM